MKRIAIFFTILLCVFAFEAKSGEFSDNLDVGLTVCPSFPSENDGVELDPGLILSLDARYKISNFISAGVSIGRHTWTAGYNQIFETSFPPVNNNETDVCSGKVPVLLVIAIQLAQLAAVSNNYQGDVPANEPDSESVNPFQPFVELGLGPYY